jgi:hypothetical protein
MTDVAAIRATAERVRMHRERRRRGMRCLTKFEIHEGEIDALVRHGLLDDGERGDTEATLAALREYLGNTLFLE